MQVIRLSYGIRGFVRVVRAVTITVPRHPSGGMQMLLQELCQEKNREPGGYRMGRIHGRSCSSAPLDSLSFYLQDAAEPEVAILLQTSWLYRTEDLTSQDVVQRQAGEINYALRPATLVMEDIRWRGESLLNPQTVVSHEWAWITVQVSGSVRNTTGISEEWSEDLADHDVIWHDPRSGQAMVCRLLPRAADLIDVGMFASQDDVPCLIEHAAALLRYVRTHQRIVFVKPVVAPP